MFKRIFSILSVVVFLVVCTGCPKVDINATKFMDTPAMDSLTILALDPIVQKNDLLFVNVSILGSESSNRIADLYNKLNTSQVGNSNISLASYLVSPKGTISMPAIGDIEVAGMNKARVVEVITTKLQKYFREVPIVTVRIVNYKIFINGEVTRPGAIDVVNELITLPQAISIAGGFSVYAVKEKVQIIREGENGKKRIAYVDLRNDDLLAKDKEFYYLKQNDQIFVPANKEKIISSNQSTARTVSYATAALTLLLTFFTLLKQ